MPLSISYSAMSLGKLRLWSQMGLALSQLHTFGRFFAVVFFPFGVRTVGFDLSARNKCQTCMLPRQALDGASAIIRAFSFCRCVGFTEKDTDEVKGMFADTNFYFLCLTFFVAAVHVSACENPSAAAHPPC